MIQSLRHYLCACTFMIAGTAAVFAVLVLVNNPPQGPERDDAEKTTFTVEQPVQQPKPVQKKMVQNKSAQPTSRGPAPPPLASLDAAIGSVDVPLPGFDLSALNSLDGSLGADQNLVMTDETADEPPQAVSQAAMEYPLAAKADGVEGYVTLSVLIGPAGDIQDVRVLESRPSGVFDDVAIEGIRQWRFQPAKYQGKPVTVWGRQTIRFDLS